MHACCYAPVLGQNVCSEADEHAGDEVQALGGSDVEWSPLVVVPAVGVDAGPEQPAEQVDAGPEQQRKQRTSVYMLL
jgi:hypothetical protein